MERDQAIAEIKKNLKARSGKSWSVTGGKGTGWGWIRISTPPKSRTSHIVLKEGATSNHPDNYEEKDTGVAGGYITKADREEMGKLLNLDNWNILGQGESIPASSAYYQEYVDRSKGITPTVYGKQYWD